MTLLDLLCRLEPGEYVVISHPEDEGLYVQAARDVDDLCVEVSGPLSDGGTADLSSAQQLALLALGWVPPQDREDSDWPNYRNEMPLGREAEAVRLLDAAMTILGIDLATALRTRDRWEAYL